MKRAARFGVAIGAAAALAVACGEDESTVGLSVDSACASFVDAVCAKTDACYAGAIRLAYGDVARCKARTLETCKSAAGAPSTAITADKIQACATGYRNVTCASVYQAAAIPECPSLAGSLAAGAACGEDSQCQSAFCGKLAGASCGTCATPPAAGGACVGGRCPSGLRCDASQKCTKPGSAGQKCVGNDDCQSDLVCNAGACGTPAKAGEACSLTGASGAQCDRLGVLWCNTVSSKCEPIKTAAAGAACGLDIASGALTVCDAAAYCQTVDAKTFKGACVARSADGAACKTDALGDSASATGSCAAPAICEGGACKVPDAATCK